METDENFKLYLIKDYQDKRIIGRVALIKFFLEGMEKNIRDRDRFTPEKGDLDFNTKLAVLQIATVSHIMIFLEDLAVFCISFLKKDLNYYQYLDGKEENDLGKIITKFYDEVDNLTNDEMREILGIIHPEKYQFNTINDKNLYVNAINKMIKVLKAFLAKAAVFRESHIGIFRRYKHATFPVFLANEIPKNDEFLKDFDFTSFAIISEGDPTKTVSSLPYRDDVIVSYRNIMTEIFLVLSTIIDYHFSAFTRKISGIMPTPYDYFNHFLNKNEKIELERIRNEFEKEFPNDGKPIHSVITPNEIIVPWYRYLGLYKKTNIDIIKEKKFIS